jgi:hypothetical protein
VTTNWGRYRITRVITPADSLALVTLDQAKAALGIDLADTSQDTALTQHIDAVSIAVNNYCSRIFAVQTYRDQLRNAYGGFGEALVTRQYPIVVEAGTDLVVTEDGAVLDPTLYEVDPDTGRLYRLYSASSAASAWTAPLILVDYTGGFNPIPPDVQGAALDWVTTRWHAAGRDPALRSETIPDVISQVYAGDAGAGTSAGAIPPGARDLLTPYRLMFV